MAVLASQSNSQRSVAFGSMAIVILWAAIGWAQKVTFTPSPDMQELEQKVESRSTPPTVTTEEESALISKGYVKLGSISSTSTGTAAGSAKALDDSIHSRAAAVGGDVVRFDKRGVPTQVTETIGPKEKTTTRCANWVNDTTYTNETQPETCYTDSRNIRHCTGGGTRLVAHTTRRCTDWEKTVSEVGSETTRTTSVLSSEGTVWRHDPDLLAAIALQRRNDANAPKPSDSVVGSFFEAIRTGDIAKVEAILKDFPGLANIKAAGRKTPLGEAAFWENKELIDVLLAHGAYINGRDLDDGQTALFQVLGYTRKGGDITEYLVSKGADVNAEDNSGFTPLSLALGKHKISVLRKHGAHTCSFCKKK